MKENMFILILDDQEQKVAEIGPLSRRKVIEVRECLRPVHGWHYEVVERVTYMDDDMVETVSHTTNPNEF